MADDVDSIPPEGREEVRAWIEQVIMDRARKLQQTIPEGLKTPEGKDWLKLRDTLREELPQYHGALTEANLREARKILGFPNPRSKRRHSIPLPKA